MPLITVKLIENVFTPKQKAEIIHRLTETMVDIEADIDFLAGVFEADIDVFSVDHQPPPLQLLQVREVETYDRLIANQVGRVDAADEVEHE